MDCSTFAFDLHVLGTPPALILSQDQTLMLNVLAFALSRSGKPFNARPIWLLRCSIRFICRGFPPVAFARTDNSGRPILRLHALTLIVNTWAETHA